MAAGSEKAHAGVFSSIRSARALPTAQVHSQFTIASVMNFGGYNRARNLANHVVDGAEYQHLHGNDAEAVERLLDALYLAEAMHRDPTLISQLVAIGLDALTCAGVEQVAPGIHVDASGQGGAATPAQVRKLIDVLLDDELLQRGMQDAIEEERAFALEVFRNEGDQTWAIRPAATRAQVRALQTFEVNVRVAAANNAADARRAAAGYVRSEGREPFVPLLQAGLSRPSLRYSRWFESDQSNLARVIEQKFRGQGERRAAAAILALQLYRTDHAGTWPAALDDLVPAYLPKLPADPFYNDGRPLGYVLRTAGRPDGADRPMVYFDAGSTDDVWIDPEPMTGWQNEANRPNGRQRDVRQYRDASLWVPKVRRADQPPKFPRYRSPYGTLPATQPNASPPKAVDQDPDEPDAPGNNPKPEDPRPEPPQQ
jgi:hypothetical protein